MELILLDWTCMGKTYCLAGVVRQHGQFRVVRPMPKSNHPLPVRNIGWSPYQMDGRQRWQIFELVAPEAAPPLAPHLEDVWVRELRTQGRFADTDTRRSVLQETAVGDGQPLFGTPFLCPNGKAYLRPGTGSRSLVTVFVPRDRIAFTVERKPGTAELLYRVKLHVPGLQDYLLPLKDHFLIERVRQAAATVEGQWQALTSMVGEMGQRVAVRVGLSRAYSATGKDEDAACWLMADGFFSTANPQP
jgi:hypothetical protein